MGFGPGMKYGQYGTNYPMHLDNATFLGFSREDRENLAFNAPGRSIVKLQEHFFFLV